MKHQPSIKAAATAIIDVAGAPTGIVQGDVSIIVDGALITARIGHFDRVDIEMTLVQAGALVKQLADAIHLAVAPVSQVAA